MNNYENLYVFELQDSMFGGIIRANSEEDAKNKLVLDKGIDLKDFVSFLKLSDAFNKAGKDVLDLW